MRNILSQLVNIPHPLCGRKQNFRSRNTTAPLCRMESDARLRTPSHSS
ncbi:unnamed protein product [Amoebophrya sp. A120]|nr:unnamed protein product [Amoebophrya sp. A120]|eukprot:GSA120T00011689001.1